MALVVYPVSLVVAGRPCLVVGGGDVARRKIDGLVAAGASVTVVAPVVVPSVEELPVTVHRRPYRPGEAADYWLCICATGVAPVDAAAAADAEAAGVWVNCADDPARCSFLLPSVHWDGSVSVAVSTGGASPALAGWLRRRVAKALGPGLGAFAEVVEDARRALRRAGRTTSSVDWYRIFERALTDIVHDGHVADAIDAIHDAVELHDVDPAAPSERVPGTSE